MHACTSTCVPELADSFSYRLEAQFQRHRVRHARNRGLWPRACMHVTAQRPQQGSTQSLVGWSSWLVMVRCVLLSAEARQEQQVAQWVLALHPCGSRQIACISETAGHATPGKKIKPWPPRGYPASCIFNTCTCTCTCICASFLLGSPSWCRQLPSAPDLCPDINGALVHERSAKTVTEQDKTSLTCS